MQTAWRPLFPSPSLGLVFVLTLIVLIGAGLVFASGVTELLGVSTDRVLSPWQSMVR